MKYSSTLTDQQIQELQTIITSSASKGPEVRRAQAVLLIDRKVGTVAVKAMTGYGRTRAFTLRKQYLVRGSDAIRDHREGQSKELLTKTQRAEIIATIQTKKPCELDTYYQNYKYWTTGVLGAYIKRSYKVAYKSKTSHYLLFKQAKFTYHKPGKVSERRSEEEVQEWRTTAKKRIQEAWNDTNTIILTEDEMHLSTQTTVQKIWLPKGEYPKIEVARKREARSIYGFLNVKEGKEHAFKTKWQNMYITATIIPEVRKLYPHKKILLVWDQAGWHKGSEAQAAIKQDGNIETIYFPTATPDENPQEHVWKSGRSKASHNRFIQNIDDATDEFVQYLNTTKFSYVLTGFSSLS
ncbi:MAG: IS630 family transposase [Candidatus Sungbacteria bacterium]|nr:IS630 family transposase [Candidatus Sungbacteria bacterium]